MPTRSDSQGGAPASAPRKTSRGPKAPGRGHGRPAVQRDGEGPTRTCVVTREEREPADLVRVVVGPDGVVEVDYRGKLGGRGAWLLPRRDVVETAEARPGQIARVLKVETVRTEGLLERVREANLRAVLDLLSLAARSGCVVGGAEAVESVTRGGPVLGFVVASDASPRSVDAARAGAPDLPAWTVPLDREALGRRVGKGARAVLVLRPGVASRNLVRELRRMQELR